MAREGLKLRAIALTTLQETLRRRVFYVVLILVVLIGMVTASSMAVLQMARQAGEAGFAETIHGQLVSTMLGLWSQASVFLALFLGAVGFSSEVTAKTIVNVLSRPVDRTSYLAGRFIGTLAFLWAFQLAGILLALVVALAFGMQIVGTLWVGFALTFAAVFLNSAVSLGLSVTMPPVLAGGITFLLGILPGIVKGATQNPNGIARFLALAAYYLSPAALPENLISKSLTAQLLTPEYSLYFKVLAENVLYAAAVLFIASAIFARREIRLR
jgi:ABC-type transport system involved in multi-copper enzyme maturation permease subunit